MPSSDAELFRHVWEMGAFILKGFPIRVSLNFPCRFTIRGTITVTTWDAERVSLWAV